jgi:anti-sigma B factor antagonist
MPLFFRLQDRSLHVVGEIDHATIEVFEARTREVVQSGPIILDMTKVDFIDSSGLGVLLRLSKLCAKPHRLQIVPSEQVRRVFQVTGLDAHPEIEFLLPPRSLERVAIVPDHPRESGRAHDHDTTADPAMGR